ncbi:MAG: hypothetical protein WDZ49_07025 [Litorilinea sp.]
MAVRAVAQMAVPSVAQMVVVRQGVVAAFAAILVHPTVVDQSVPYGSIH